MSTDEIEKVFLEYINKVGGMDSPFGKLEFTSKDRIGQGGNGLVYLARINGKDVAVKFLISDSDKKTCVSSQNISIQTMQEINWKIL